MSSVVIAGDTSGSVTLSAPSVAGTTTLTLPSTSGTVLTTASGQWITTGSDIYYNTGAVLIGTSSNPDSYKFLCNSGSSTEAIRAISSSTTGTGVSINNTSTGGYNWNIFSAGSAATVGTAGSLVFRDSTSGATRMTITNSGATLVGTNVIDAAATFHYVGRLNVKGQAVEGSSVLAVRYAGTSAFRNVSLENDNGQVGYIQTSNSTTTYSTSSDYRLKENVAPMTGALNKVMQLNPVTFTWKSDGSDGQGFIAHELQLIIPDAVGGEKDAIREDGTPEYQGVDTSFLVATLTAAIKELKAELDTVKTELAILKGAA